MSCAFLTSNTSANGSNVDESGASYTLDSSCGQAIAFKHSTGANTRSLGYGYDVTPTITTDDSTAVAFSQYGDVAGTLTARHDSSPCADRGQSIVCMADTQANASIDADVAGTLTRHSHNDPPMVSDGIVVRRLTPLECERLQGFPSIVKLEVDAMTQDELIACALANGDITVDFKTGKVYGHRGPGGIELDAPRELGFLHPNGYVYIHLSTGGEKRQVRVHRIVYTAAYGAIPEGMVIDHINNDKSDNRLSNLQLMTPEGNSRKAKLDGLHLTGDDNPASKVSVEVRQEIVHEYASGNCTYRDLAKRYGISKSRVCQIVHESGWTDIPGARDGPRYKALGNSMAVPVMRWIGERIAEVDALEDE